MQQYMNLGGNSGVIAFEIGHGQIQVQFGDGSVYLYTTSSAGSNAIQEMCRLAEAGAKG